MKVDDLGLGILVAALVGWLAASRRRSTHEKIAGMIDDALPDSDKDPPEETEDVAWLGNILDRREFAKLSDRAAPYVRSRDPDSVDAVVLHQMGFSRGSDPSRYDKVTAHYKILPDGAIVWSHEWGTRLPASNGFNGRSIAVEFAGNFPKVARSQDRRDFWNPDKMGADQLTGPQIVSGQKLMRYLYDKGIRFVFAHRQSSASRGIDPGPDIWANVGEFAIGLGMSDGGPGFTVGDGRSIPDAWRGGAVA